MYGKGLKFLIFATRKDLDVKVVKAGRTKEQFSYMIEAHAKRNMIKHK